jgi:hypothetical protein
MKTVLLKTPCGRADVNKNLSATLKRILSSHNTACRTNLSNKPPRPCKIKEKTENTQHIVPFSGPENAVKERDTSDPAANALPLLISYQYP